MTTQAKHPGLLLVLCGPSGVGKSTIALELQAHHGVTYAVSATTRAHKQGDERGKKYEHVTREEFFRRLDADQFLEYAQVYDEYYGTPKHPYLDELAGGRDVVLDIDVQGALQVRYQYPDAVLVFVLPPDEPTLLDRLKGRERDTADEIAKRFRASRREIHMAKGSRAFDYMVINDELDRAVAEIVKIIKHKKSGDLRL